MHILVVDDSTDAADSCAELLALWGYDAVACYDGPAALRSARLRRPDAVLLDLAMPGMDGFRFAGLFRKVPGCAAAPVVVVSGYSTPAHRAAARVVGVRHYLLKPVDPTRLKGLLARVLARPLAPGPLLAAAAGDGPSSLLLSGRRVHLG